MGYFSPMKLLTFALLCAATCMAAEIGGSKAPPRQFKAGAAASNITPWMGLSINGNMTDHRGTNVHDQLHARAIVLDDGVTRLAIVVADSCMIYRETFDAAKQLLEQRIGLPASNILISATHTHSAPAAVSIFQSDADKEYQHFLTLRLADAVQQAIVNLAPARIGWGIGSEPRHVFNRRWRMKPGVVNGDPFGGTNDLVKMNPRPGNPDLLEPAGPTDPEVPVLALRTIDGRPLALLANYSMHYCGVPAHTFSADYFGAFCDRIQQRLAADRQEPPFVAVLSNGTSGDCNSMNFREAPKPEAPFERVHTVANDVAEVALQVYENIQWHDWVELKSAHKEILLGVRKADAAQLANARETLAKAKKQAGQYGGWSPEVYAREAVLLAAFPDQVPVLLQAFRIGDLGIAAIPCEVFAQIGLTLKKESPLKPMFTIELANGYNGYLPTPEQHKLGGYETWRARSSYLDVQAAPKIEQTILALLAQTR
jgi:neutral ceramidase